LTRRLSNFEIRLFFWAAGENGAELGRFFYLFSSGHCFRFMGFGTMRVYCALFFSRGEIGMEWADQGGCLSGGQLLCREEQGSVRVLGWGGGDGLKRGVEGAMATYMSFVVRGRSILVVHKKTNLVCTTYLFWEKIFC
jgi:hypothetical protein